MMDSNWLTEFGFSKNPYDTKALSSEEGDKLLVGRDDETKLLTEHLISSASIPLLIGDNGVGKTSIINVVAYRMSKKYVAGNQRYFALRLKGVQGSQLSDLVQFEQSVYHGVLHLLLDEKNFLKDRGVKRRDISDADKLLRKLFNPNIGVGAGPVSVSYANTPNPSSEPYLIQIAQEWLRKCFCNPYSGGIICLIDNLENNQTSSQVQSNLENLRDTLFDIPGLLWVLCGTPSAVKGTLSSARLDGRLAPQDIQYVEKHFVPTLIKRRIEYYGNQNADPPIDEDGFKYIYAVLNSQLRSTLGLCQEFAEHLHNHPQRQSNDRLQELKIWLNQKAAGLVDRLSGIPDRTWRLFDLIADLGSDIESNSSKDVTIESAEQLDKIAKPLIDNGLLSRVEMDDDNFRLKVTQKGCLVSYQRNNYGIAGEVDVP